MREIKFKAQRADGKGWVYGYYVLRPNGKHLIYWKPFKEATQNTYHEIDPETVCQFTGLQDKNKVDIYEWDVLKNSNGYTYFVKYLNGAFYCFHSKLKDSDNEPLRWGGVWRFDELNIEIEVIGSIINNSN